MAETHVDEKEIFEVARKIPGGELRESYVQDACGGDDDLKQGVSALLRAYDQCASYLESPALGLGDAPDIDFLCTEGAGTVIGPYRLLEQIGEGGMGVVYMADQQGPVRRRVALKIIKPGMDTRQIIARFEAERQALALMDHSNIARVLDAGATDSGRPYFVMELVRGIPITEYCDRNNLPVHERLELFIQVCHAVQHAHQKGIIHRDIKPTNVLVTLHDGRPVPKVIDFGVAKATGPRLTEKTLFTNFDQMIGTPLYMSPEQAEMTGLDVDTRSDIYSLGVLLYELLTGTTPFDRERLRDATLEEVRRIIREDEPAKPSTRISTLLDASQTAIAAHRKVEPNRLRQLVRGDLDWIAMKCLEKDRNRRYETASALAMDIQRYIADEPVLARPPSTRYRFRKFARRNKSALVMATVVGSALLLTVAGLAVSTVRIARQNRTTESAKADLQDTLERERRDSYFHRIALAHRELSVNNLRRALQLLGECPEDLQDWEWRYLKRLCRVEPTILRDSSEVESRSMSEVNSVAFSPDGERLASAGGDGTLKVWNCATGKVIQRFNAHNGFVCSVTFHPDGKHLASVGADKRVKVWDLTSEKSVFERRSDTVHVYGAAYAVAFSPDGNTIAAGSAGDVRVWDWKDKDNPQPKSVFAGHDKRPICVAFSHDGRRLASGSWRGQVRLWDVEAGGKPLCTFTETHESRHPVCALAFRSDDGRLASASFNRRVDVWDTTTGGFLHSLAHSGIVQCVAFSPDGRRIASSGEDKIVRVWDATTGREVLGLHGHTSHCGCVAFSPDGHRLASASMDGTIRIWDATPLKGHEGQETLTFPQHSNEIWSLAVSPDPDGQRIVSAGFSTPATVWDVQTGQVQAEFDGHRDVVFCVAWQPDGQRIASAGADGGLFTVKVWDARTGREIFTLPGTQPGDPEFFSVAFSPDGRYLVTGRLNGIVQVWDARTGDAVGTLGKHERAMRGVAISRDGLHLATVSADGLVRLWDATRLNEKQVARHVLRGRVLGPCLNVAFSPDSQRLATGGEENTVKIWNVQTGAELLTLRGHNGDIYTVAFSPDPAGRWVASAGEDSIVNVWDSRSGGAPVRSFRGHTGLVSSVAFTADGRRLISGSRDHTVKVWDVTALGELPEGK